MARSKKDENLALLVCARYRSAGYARASRDTEWEKARRRYEPGYVDRKKVRRPPYIKVGYTFNTVNFKAAQLISASEANGLWLQARATTPESGNVGEVVTQVLERVFRWKGATIDADNEEQLERTAQGALLYGNTPVHCRWYEDGDDWGVRFETVNPYDFFKDPHHGRWYMVRRWMTVGQLGDRVRGDWSATVTRTEIDPDTGEPVDIDMGPRDGGKASRAFKRILKQVRDGIRGGTITSTIFPNSKHAAIDLDRVSDTSVDEADDHALDPDQVPIEVLHYFETGSHGITAVVVDGFGSGSPEVLRSGINEYGVCTLADFIPFPIGDEAWGYGLGEIIGAVQEALDYLFRSQLRLVAKKADEPLLHRRGARLDDSFLRNPSGKAAQVSDINSDVGYLQSGSDPGLYSFAMGLSRQIVDISTGMSEAKRGNAQGAETATEAAIAEAAGTVLDRMIFRRWRKFVEKLGQISLAILKKHVTSERMIPWLGRDADEFLRLRPEFLEGTFEVEFGGSLMGMNPSQEVTALINFGSAFAQSGVVDMNALARMVARRIGIRNPDEVLTAKAGRPQVSPRHENDALFRFGQEIEVHPADDDMNHITGHSPVLRQVSASEPAHPGIPTMQGHIRDHMTALMLKQGMGGQAPGQQPGQPQGQPGGAFGGAGQPLADTPATRQAVAARQAPNVAANGGAPGGVTVPGRRIGDMVRGGPR